MVMKRPTILAGVGLVLALMPMGAPAVSAKGGWDWHVWDRDGFLVVGQHVRAQASFPDTKPYPTHAWLIEIDWEAQPRSLPRARISLGELSPERFRLRGQRLVAVELRFAAPEQPGNYAIVTCVHPCNDIATYPAPSAVNVVADESEARVRAELLERDADIDRVAHRIRRSRARVRDLTKRIDEQMGYLSNHVTRIHNLEKVVSNREGGDDGTNGRFALWTGVLGGAAGFAIGLRRRKPS